MPKASSSAPNRRYSKVFRDPKKLEEAIDLIKRGRPLAVVARIYGVHHTSIAYQCKKVRLIVSNFAPEIAPTSEKDSQRTEMSKYARRQMKGDVSRLIKKGRRLEEIAETYGIPVDAIVFFCKREKIEYRQIYKKLGVDKDGKYLTEDGYPRWIADPIEGNICRGKGETGRKEELRARMEKERQKKRKDLLDY